MFDKNTRDKYKKIAIMGGTFDPIHYGHLVTAELVRSEFDIDLMLFIPTGSPPHKQDYKVTYSEHRYLMATYATSANPYFAVSRIEIERPGKTYTIDTLNELRFIYGSNAQFYFITGADAVNQIMNWKDAEELLSMCNFVAVTRPGYSNEELRKKSDELNSRYGSSIFYFEIPALAISSSDIRARVRANKPIRYLLPGEVEAHIVKCGLYREKNSISVDEIKNFLRKSLSERRYRHTLNVSYLAGKLAEHYGCDTYKAYIAGLLHDMAKELPNDKKLELCGDFGIAPDEYCLKQPDLLHGRLSAELAKREFEIEDLDIFDAVTYHTTGYADMPLLSKIIFVADIIDPGRDIRNKTVNERRAAIEEAAYRDLNAAVAECLRIKLEFTAEGNREIHPLSKRALDWYEKNGG